MNLDRSFPACFAMQNGKDTLMKSGYPGKGIKFTTEDNGTTGNNPCIPWERLYY
jgi:hypothetical protein